MDVRHATHPDQVAGFDTGQLRAHYLVDDLFPVGRVAAVYSHEDRLVLAGTVPEPGSPVRLPTFDQLRSEFFLQRREAGVINVGGPGTVTVDGTEYALGNKDCVYIGRDAHEVTFATAGTDSERARFYLVSTPAHTTYPTEVARLADVAGARLGGQEGANARTLRRYIHDGGIASCQLVMGVTILEPGSMWNSMPCHTHDRRTEVYLYTDVPAEARVVHLMGEPQQTRNLIVADGQAVISPSWSIHCGFGTSNYAFVWAMGGENKAFEDMDELDVTELL